MVPNLVPAGDNVSKEEAFRALALSSALSSARRGVEGQAGHGKRDGSKVICLLRRKALFHGAAPAECYVSIDNEDEITGPCEQWNKAAVRTLGEVRIGEGFPTFSDRSPSSQLSPAHEYSRGFSF